MLTTLRIKNLGLVDDITLELGPGYTTLTGETGAGKSMIIGALDLILGQRADRKLVRTGADACTIEAVFETATLRAPLPEFLMENGLEPCEDDTLHIKRTVTRSGSNRQFINHSPASLNLLSQLGRWLVDIHGPYDHQSLFDSQTQLELLDAFAGTTADRLAYAEVVAAIRALEQDKAELITDEQSYAQQLDLLRFQTHEIAAARLDQIDEASLEQEFHRAQNAAQIQTLCQAIQGALSEGEPNLTEMMGQLGQGLHQLDQLDPQSTSLGEFHVQLSELVDDLQSELNRYQDTIDLDPARLVQLEEQINSLQSLKRKYGNTVPEILKFGTDAAEKLAALESRDSEIERINSLIRSHLNQLERQAKELSRQRQQKASQLSEAIVTQLADLGFTEGRFEVQIQERPVNFDQPESLRPSGTDHIEFLFGPNPGEPLHPLRKIASSGEMARVMLALKTVLAAEDDIPLLVFDEVDANVGGETAHAVGEKMHGLGESHQILCITHLAPVAASADHHLRVTKERTGDRTETAVQLLDRKERVNELSRMLGGKVKAAQQHAKALLG